MELSELRHGTELIKRGFASMQKGGVIMDVVNAEQAKDRRRSRRSSRDVIRAGTIRHPQSRGSCPYGGPGTRCGDH